MLTIAKMGAHSVAYYQSTVDENRGPDSYYSEDGKQPATVWTRGENVAEVSAFLGTDNGAIVSGKTVEDWFNKSVAPSGARLGKALGDKGVPGFDLTFCAPKSVSLLWAMGDDSDVRSIVDEAHQAAVSQALDYLSEHAGYTRKQDPLVAERRLIVEKVAGISGVKYEHRTSRAGDPHVHSHVLLANKQLCQDGKVRTLDGVSLYHEARAAGMVYQATVREILSRELGVEFGEVVNGCAEIVGLDDSDLIAQYSTRAREIDQWQADNGLDVRASYERVAQKITRRAKDTDTPLEDLEVEWAGSKHGVAVRDFVSSLGSQSAKSRALREEVLLPSASQILAEVVAQRSTFTRADIAEKAAELIRPGIVKPADMMPTVECLVDACLAEAGTWSVTPERSRYLDKTQREGSQKYTTDIVVDEVERGVDMATIRVNQGVKADSIQPRRGTLSPAQADAMRAVVSSDYLASVVVAPAGAGKTSSLTAAHRAWNKAGKHVIGLAPTGKAADVMVGEDVADEAMTIARAFVGTETMTMAETVEKIGWGRETVVVVDEAGMVSNPDMIRVLEAATLARARVVFVGDPEQYSAVKARSGLLATLAHELPDAVELAEVFRQRDAGEREASTWLRGGEEVSVRRAAQWYMTHHRLHAGSVTSMMDDALAGWREDTQAGKQSLLVAATREQVTALNAAAQKIRVEREEVNLDKKLPLADGLLAGVGDTILTRRNNAQLVTSSGDSVRNGQRWSVESIGHDGSIVARRVDGVSATVTLDSTYLSDHVQLGYAATGHSSQGTTVDVARVVAGAGNLDKASVYVPMTRGRDGNYLYIAETQPGDTETGHGSTRLVQRREDAEYARDLLVAAGLRDQGDKTPQGLWGQARQDWELFHLVSRSASLSPDSPFAGTPMGRYMETFTAKRDARLADFHARSQNVDTTPVRAKETSVSQADKAAMRRRELESAIDNNTALMTANANEVARVKEKLDTLRAHQSQAREQVEGLKRILASHTRAVEKLEEQKNSRGLLGKLRHSKDDQAAVDEATQRRDSIAVEYTQATDHCDSFNTPIHQAQEELAGLQRDRSQLKEEADKHAGHRLLATHGIGPFDDGHSVFDTNQQATYGNKQETSADDINGRGDTAQVNAPEL
ncbi:MULTISPECIES: MobF family relaxase [Actinomycetes]|uniref:MobF family relaxase n=1 Tax=Actinomycetes TaxID=1760 RepID=UPI002648E9F8|nr:MULTISPECIES: MobF family relaxase [Actinomycetes]MDN6457241.1 relaxase domain-containing protein [Yaniella sp.]MDN6646396.1 relaxase domain-containing protein [Corynebacterium flavescens]